MRLPCYTFAGTPDEHQTQSSGQRGVGPTAPWTAQFQDTPGIRAGRPKRPVCSKLLVEASASTRLESWHDCGDGFFFFFKKKGGGGRRENRAADLCIVPNDHAHGADRLVERNRDVDVVSIPSEWGQPHVLLIKGLVYLARRIDPRSRRRCRHDHLDIDMLGENFDFLKKGLTPSTSVSAVLQSLPWLSGFVHTAAFSIGMGRLCSSKSCSPFKPTYSRSPCVSSIRNSSM